MDIKRIIISICLGLFSSSIFAQVEIEKYDFFSPFKLATYKFDVTNDSALINPSIGANVNWNFSQTSLSQETSIDIQPINWATTDSIWPEDTYLLNSSSSLKPIVSSSNNQYSLLGFFKNDQLIKFQTPEIRFNLPFNYGDTFYSNTKYVYSRDTSFLLIFDSVRTSTSRFRTLTTQGFGNFSLNGDIHTAMLSKEVLISIDTVEYHNTLLGWIPSLVPSVFDTTLIYHWYAKNIGAEVATLEKKSTGINTFTLLKSLPVISSVNTLQMECNIFPNPFCNEITISLNEPIKQISIYDNLGRLVFENTSQGNYFKQDLSFLNNGFYQISILTTNHKITKTILKQ